MNDEEKRSLMFSHRDNFCTIIYRLSHLCELMQNDLLRKYGLTHQQTQVLAYIVARQEHTVRQRDIENGLFLKSSTVTELLNILERDGYVTRERCQEDKRAKRLVATEKAKNMHQVFMDSILAVDGALCDGMDDIERVLLKKLLLEAYNNVGKKVQ